MHQRSERAVATRATWWARLCGVVAGVAGLAIAGLVSWAIAPLGAPVTAVGELIINLLPAPLINFGKETLGTADKPILIALVTIGVLVLCGLAGQLELRRTFAGAAVFAVVAVIGLLGVAAQPGATVNAYVPTIVGLLLGYMLLSTLLARLQRWRPRRAVPMRAGAVSAARREFLGWTLVTGALAAVGAVGAQLLTGAASAVTSTRDKLRLPTSVQPAPPAPAGADLGLPGLSPYVTPNDDFYRIDTALQVPVIDPADWTLRVTGLVEQEVQISFSDLQAKPLVEHIATLTCVSNEVGGDLVGNARWLGYPIRDLLAEAKPKAGADMVLSTSDDGWTAGTPLAALTDPDRQALLAIGMNGDPLPIEHGFPVRMVVPGLYGYVSATKWVRELRVTRFDADQGYWTPLGWSALGPIKLASRIDVPHTTVDAGTVMVAGVAWAQHTGVSLVEVQIDGGGWQRATLAETTGPDTWRQWSYAWLATTGSHKITVRATDTDGKLQVAEPAAPAPDGATGYHTVRVKVR